MTFSENFSGWLRTKFFPVCIRALASTWRFEIQKKNFSAPAVIAFWHGEMLPFWKFFSREEISSGKIVGVTSRSKDGDILASLLESWGYKVIRGSSSKGGKEVLDEMAAAAKENFVLVTPDGPRGPIHEMKPGAVVAAHRARAALILCRAKILRKKILLKAWDKFEIPMPFTKIILEFSEEIFLPENSTRGEISEAIEECGQMLNSMGEKI